MAEQLRRAARVLTADQAAWIRAHAWTTRMRKTHAEAPAYYTTCPCQGGPSGYCAAGWHRRCDHQPGRPRPPVPETWICRRSGEVLAFRGWRYRHRTQTITGRRHLGEAAVWPADRRCVWHCPCDCHLHGGPVGGQLDLFTAARPPLPLGAGHG